MAEKNLKRRKNAEGSENVVDRLARPGLNLFIVSKKQRNLFFNLSVPLFIAELKGIWKNRVPGDVVWFSLETSRKKSLQMFSGYTTVMNQIFGIYAYKYGYFGESIKEGMGIFLKDNPHTKLVVIDSIEKIVEGEIGPMDYRQAYEILQGIRPVAIRFDVPMLITMHKKDYGDGSKWTEVSDAAIRITKSETQDNWKYTLCLKEKGKTESKMAMVFDSEIERWGWITYK